MPLFKICFMLVHTVLVCVRIQGSLCGQVQVYTSKNTKELCKLIVVRQRHIQYLLQQGYLSR